MSVLLSNSNKVAGLVYIYSLETHCTRITNTSLDYSTLSQTILLSAQKVPINGMCSGPGTKSRVEIALIGHTGVTTDTTVSIHPQNTPKMSRKEPTRQIV